jgi:hypothetical protein
MSTTVHKCKYMHTHGDVPVWCGYIGGVVKSGTMVQEEWVMTMAYTVEMTKPQWQAWVAQQYQVTFLVSHGTTFVS